MTGWSYCTVAAAPVKRQTRHCYGEESYRQVVGVARLELTVDLES